MRTRAGLVALLVAAAVLVGWAGDIRVGSGSDAGGKLATARVMADRSTCDPDIGWWAADVDAEGDLHQIFNTAPVGDRYVQATSPTYQCLVMPLQQALGPWGPVAVSIAGAVAAALAAAAIARRLGADATGQTAAFLLVGVAGPVFHYAIDVWEHAPALGVLLTGVALVLGPPTPKRAALAGVCFGAASVLRAEMVVYVGVLAAVGIAIAEIRRRWLSAPRALIAGGVGAAAVVVGNLVVENIIVSTSIRASRGSHAVEESAGDLGERVRTAFVTGTGFLASDDSADLVLGVAVVLVVLLAARRLATPAERYATALPAARWAYGTGFVPGVFPAAPFALAGIWQAGRSTDHRWLVTTSLVAMPAVWMLQWPGLHVAAWGGRYLLATGALLTAVACSQRLTKALAPLLVACAAVGLLSAVWHVQRSNAIGRVIDAVESVPDDSVVVTFDVNLGREAGGTYGDVRWLAVGGDAEGDLAAEVIDVHQPAHLTVVHREGQDEPAPFPGYTRTSTEERTELGNTWIIRRFDRG